MFKFEFPIYLVQELETSVWFQRPNDNETSEYQKIARAAYQYPRLQWVWTLCSNDIFVNAEQRGRSENTKDIRKKSRSSWKI